MKRVVWVAAAAAVAGAPMLASTAQADDAQILERIDAMQKQLEQQQQEMAAQKAEIDRLRTELKGKAKKAKKADIDVVPMSSEVATRADVDALRAQVDADRNRAKLERQEQPVWSVVNLRPTVQSPDGRFSLSLRGQIQFDMANYFQDAPGPLATDFRRGSQGASQREVNSARELSDGVNFRRAQIGVEGKFWRDFNYRLMLEFGGSGTEGPARINDAYVNYTGFAPFTFQIGAFLPNSNMEDSTSASEILFMERATAAELSRALAGADGRYGAGVRGNGERWFASLYWTGGTVGDAENAGEQGSLVGRIAGLALTGSDYNLHFGANGSWVFEPPDQGSIPSATTPRYPIRFRDRPELRVDGTRLIDTGSIDAESAYAAGLEAAGNWKNFFFQGEYFKYGIDRRLNPITEDPEFSGWYAQASWVLTGETHRYSMANASFGAPRPMVPVSADGGWGAWEVAGRFSHVDLNFREGVQGGLSPLGSVRGGEEDIWTIGVNWYLNANLRASFNYFMVDVDRLSPGNSVFGAGAATPPDGAQIGQDYDAIALRTQFTF